MLQDIPNNCHHEMFTVYLSDTSCYGNVFYLIYHKWVATAKENFFLEKVQGFTNLLKEHGIRLIIFESYLKIFRELRLHDKVSVFISCSTLKKLKAHLKYVLVDKNGEKVAEAENKLVFVNRDGKIIAIPEVIHQALLMIKG